jgi:GAF domain-containing protein
MRLYSGLRRKYPEDLIMLVEALAHTGALAIQNASMYLKLQQDKESLEKDIWSHRSWF